MSSWQKLTNMDYNLLWWRQKEKQCLSLSTFDPLVNSDVKGALHSENKKTFFPGPLGLVLEKPLSYLPLFRLCNVGPGDLLPDEVLSILGNSCSLFRFPLRSSLQGTSAAFLHPLCPWDLQHATSHLSTFYPKLSLWKSLSILRCLG